MTDLEQEQLANETEQAADALEEMARDRANYAATVDPDDRRVGTQVSARRAEEEADFLWAGAAALRVKALLVKALEALQTPSDVTLDALDDDERTGRRELPTTLNIGQLRSINAALAEAKKP